MCKRNTPDKNKASIGCLRETPHIKDTEREREREREREPAWDV